MRMHIPKLCAVWVSGVPRFLRVRQDRWYGGVFVVVRFAGEDRETR